MAAITLVLIAAAGSFVADAILLAIGIRDLTQFWPQYVQNLKVSVLITLLFGIAISAYESLRARLEETTLQLRTQELERERALKLATEARLSSLESRIHPHFLFNTLNSISSLIPEDPARAERLIDQMAALLRFSLDAKQAGLVPLSSEMKIVHDYLEIERARFGDRLRFGFDVPAEFDAVDVPPLSIQTLVENSVKYAVSPRREGGVIRVTAAKRGGRVELEVWDDGAGFTIDSVLGGPRPGQSAVPAAHTLWYGCRARGTAYRERYVSCDIGAGVDDEMKPLKAFLVDDEELALRRLARLLQDTSRVEIVGRCSDPIDAIARLQGLAVDVLFLDIEMPGMTGFEMLEQLQAEPLVIFTTAYHQYSLQAFDVNSIGYLLKPIEPQQLEKALNKLDRIRGGACPELGALLQQISSALHARAPAYPDRVASKAGERVEFIELERVTHIYAADKLTYAATAAKHYCLDLTISELEAKLDPKKFVRIHRSTIVNASYVHELYSWFAGRMSVLRLKDEKKTELTVARDRVKALKEHLGILIPVRRSIRQTQRSWRWRSLQPWAVPYWAQYPDRIADRVRCSSPSVE